jgi:hypothetical protein
MLLIFRISNVRLDMGVLFSIACIFNLLGWSAIADFVQSEGAFFFLVILAVNIGTTIRLIKERKFCVNVKFRTSQLIYIISAILFAITGVVCIFFDWTSLDTIRIVFIICYAVMSFACITVGASYLVCYLEIRNNTGNGEFFLPAGDDNRKNIVAALARVGVMLILVGVLLLVIGWFDATDTGDIEHTVCNTCNGNGCSRCDGFGLFIGRGRGENQFGGIAFFLILGGIASLVVSSKIKKRMESTISIPTDESTYTTISSVTHDGKWICGNCQTENSMNYGQCKKCGKYRG